MRVGAQRIVTAPTVRTSGNLIFSALPNSTQRRDGPLKEGLIKLATEKKTISLLVADIVQGGPAGQTGGPPVPESASLQRRSSQEG